MLACTHTHTHTHTHKHTHTHTHTPATFEGAELPPLPPGVAEGLGELEAVELAPVEEATEEVLVGSG